MTLSRNLTDRTKVRIFDLLFYYFLPFLGLFFIGILLSNIVETFWLPSEKELWTYTTTFYTLHILRMIFAIAVFAWYMKKAGFFLKKWNEPKDLVAGFGAGLLISFFFFLLTQIQPGFAVISPQGPLFILETFLYRGLPLFMIYALGPHLFFGENSSVWIVVLWSAVLQVIWNLCYALWSWAQFSVPLQDIALTLFPNTTLLLAAALLHLRGIYTGIFVLIASNLAYAIALYFNKFPQPNLINSAVTLLAAFFLVRMIQLGFGPGKKKGHSSTTST